MYFPLRSATFWLSVTLSFLLCGGIFAWEAGLLSPTLPGPLRPPVTTLEIFMSSTIVVLFALTTGLYVWRKREGSCPRGTGRATGLAGILGGMALICPACTVIPFSILGASFTLGFLIPFLPLVRLIAILLLMIALWMVWPRRL